ncbi:MAG TPA: four helix bundle protein [Balneolaceae bacterium]|nr:four helix bundle protein [Balneolaceae bacterium]
MNNFRKLNVWKKAIKLATAIYEQTDTFPKEERYGLTSQMRRCAVSVGSNIAEGAGRGSGKEFRQFLNIATGSCYELETQLIISRNLNYIGKSEFKTINSSVVEIQKMLHSLKKAIV